MGSASGYPRASIQDGSDIADVGDTGDLVLPEWFAEKEGIE